jgi:hypothetical protein
VDDLRGPDDPPEFVLHRGDRQRHPDLRPSFVEPLRLEAPDVLATRQPGEDVVLFGDALFRDQDRDVPADGLLGGIAEEPLARSFQLVITPFRVLAMIASPEDETMAARYACSRSARARSVISRNDQTRPTILPRSN